jgi:hydrogenase maturation factor
VKPIPPTSGAELEEALQQLDAKKQAWVDLQDAEKAKLLRRCIACTVAVCNQCNCDVFSSGPQPPQSTVLTRDYEMLSLRARCTC